MPIGLLTPSYFIGCVSGCLPCLAGFALIGRDYCCSRACTGACIWIVSRLYFQKTDRQRRLPPLPAGVIWNLNFISCSNHSFDVDRFPWIWLHLFAEPINGVFYCTRAAWINVIPCRTIELLFRKYLSWGAGHIVKHSVLAVIKADFSAGHEDLPVGRADLKITEKQCRRGRCGNVNDFGLFLL